MSYIDQRNNCVEAFIKAIDRDIAKLPAIVQDNQDLILIMNNFKAMVSSLTLQANQNEDAFHNMLNEKDAFLQLCKEHRDSFDKLYQMYIDKMIEVDHKEMKIEAILTPSKN